VSYTQEKYKKCRSVDGWNLKLDLDEKLEKTLGLDQTWVLDNV